MNKRSALFSLAACLLAACASRAPIQQVEPQPITNNQGHVIGHREMVNDRRTGQQTEKVTYYVPRYDEQGVVVAYEEPVPDGVLIRAPDGRKIGVRYGDLRSRGTNSSREGITVTVPSERRADEPAKNE
jgi:uncharacterized protein YcfL